MDELNNREEIAEPEKMAQQSANIIKKNRLILLDCWNKIDKKQDLPEDFFNPPKGSGRKSVRKNKDPKLAGFTQRLQILAL